ncbi:MAG: FAD-dependent oxidoreductase [Bradymonadales bacterium]|nr:MAG: FAD-dependent oxidoreductase [Bradymonadales bacterium]
MDEGKDFLNQKVIIIGAGIAGLSAAHRLKEGGVDCVLLEKARGVGGRMATRSYGELRFDFGAQYFTVRDPAFEKEVQNWKSRGWLNAWRAEFLSGDAKRRQEPQERWVSPDGIRRLMAKWSEGLTIQLEWRANRLERSAEAWKVFSKDGRLERAEYVMLSCPAPQAIDLLTSSEVSKTLAKELESFQYEPCLALLFELSRLPTCLEKGAFWPPSESSVRWIANNQDKGLCEGLAVTVHLAGAVSEELWEVVEREEPQEFWKRERKGRLRALSDFLEEPGILHGIHRWRYSQPKDRSADSRSQSFLVSRREALYIIGDAFLGGRVEGAYLSGRRAAEDLLKETS